MARLWQGVRTLSLSEALTHKMEVYTLETIEEVLKMIQSCEGNHTQQIAYSSYHNALTQICFDCDCVRTNLKDIKT